MVPSREPQHIRLVFSQPRERVSIPLAALLALFAFLAFLAWQKTISHKVELAINVQRPGGEPRGVETLESHTIL